MPVASSAPTGGDINDSTTTTSCTRSSTEPTVAAPACTATTASVKPAGINVLLPSGNTTRNSTAPCRSILPNTCNNRPTNGCRGRVTVTSDGKTSIPVVRRVFLRRNLPWRPGGTMSTPSRRVRRRAKGLPTWRIVRYADDFAVLVHGNESDVHDLRTEIVQVLATMGLAFSEVKTRVVHMSEGFDFLGFRIQWRRKMGTNKWHVYTFIADRPVRSLKVKIRVRRPGHHSRTRKRY